MYRHGHVPTYIFMVIYICKHVCLWACGSTNLWVFLVPAQQEARKESFPLLPSHLLSHLETQRAVSWSQPASASFSQLPSISVRFQQLPPSSLSERSWGGSQDRSGSGLPSASFIFPPPTQSDCFWDGPLTWARLLRHLFWDFAVGTRRAEQLFFWATSVVEE